MIRLSSLKGVKHTHSSGGTAEEVTGITEFKKGALLQVVGVDTNVFLGTTKAQAEANLVCAPQGVPLLVKLPKNDTTLWVDATTAKIVVITEVTDLNVQHISG